MKIAVFSDVHGNCVALDAVLSDVKKQRVDGMVCLGDAIQGGSQPAETVSRLRDLQVPTVMGNSDSWLLSGKSQSQVERVSDAQLKVRAWSLSRLNEKDLDFIRQFKKLITLPLGDESLVCFHGSPASFDDLIWPATPEADFVRMLDGYGKFHTLWRPHTCNNCGDSKILSTSIQVASVYPMIILRLGRTFVRTIGPSMP